MNDQVGEVKDIPKTTITLPDESNVQIASNVLLLIGVFQRDCPSEHRHQLVMKHHRESRKRKRTEHDEDKKEDADFSEPDSEVKKVKNPEVPVPNKSTKDFEPESGAERANSRAALEQRYRTEVRGEICEFTKDFEPESGTRKAKSEFTKDFELEPESENREVPNFKHDSEVENQTLVLTKHSTSNEYPKRFILHEPVQTTKTIRLVLEFVSLFSQPEISCSFSIAEQRDFFQDESFKNPTWICHPSRKNLFPFFCYDQESTRKYAPFVPFFLRTKQQKEIMELCHMAEKMRVPVLMRAMERVIVHTVFHEPDQIVDLFQIPPEFQNSTPRIINERMKEFQLKVQQIKEEEIDDVTAESPLTVDASSNENNSHPPEQ